MRKIIDAINIMMKKIFKSFGCGENIQKDII